MKPNASPDPWRNGSASDSRSEGCVFDSRRVQYPGPIRIPFSFSCFSFFFFLFLLLATSRLSSVFEECRASASPAERQACWARLPRQSISRHGEGAPWQLAWAASAFYANAHSVLAAHRPWARGRGAPARRRATAGGQAATHQVAFFFFFFWVLCIVLRKSRADIC